MSHQRREIRSQLPTGPLPPNSAHHGEVYRTKADEVPDDGPKQAGAASVDEALGCEEDTNLPCCCGHSDERDSGQ